MFFKSKTNLLIFLYLLIVFIYTIIFIFFEPSQKVLLTSNELGDFLAGVFAPLAFFYLYLGFKQQGEAINKSNDAIKKQLEIQTEMIELQKEERLAREHAAKPILTFTPKILSGNEIILEQNNFVEVPNTLKSRLEITLGNKGSKITHVSIKCIKPFFKMLNSGDTVLDINEKQSHSCFIDRNLFSNTSNSISDIDIEVTYTTSTGATYKSVFEINLPQGLDGENMFYSSRVYPIRIN